MLGFIALILRPERHRKVRDVIRKLPLERLLLKTDAPLLTEPVHAICDFNTPYGILYVAEEIAVLKGLRVEDVIKTHLDNARQFYNLSHCRGGELLGLSLSRHSLALRCAESYPMLSGYVLRTYQKGKGKIDKIVNNIVKCLFDKAIIGYKFF